jgi:hypothetical protein
VCLPLGTGVNRSTGGVSVEECREKRVSSGASSDSVTIVQWTRFTGLEQVAELLSKPAQDGGPVPQRASGRLGRAVPRHQPARIGDQRIAPATVSLSPGDA